MAMAVDRPAPLHAGPALPWHLRLLLPLLVFSAFLTQTKLIPNIRNNVGYFEIVGGLVVLAVLLGRELRNFRFDPLLRIVFVIVLAAAASQVNLPATHRTVGLIQVLILVFLLLFLTSLQSIVTRYRISPRYLLGLVTLSVLVVGPWVLFQGISSGGDIQAAGPFRNRAHMASYMLTSFWLVLIYVLWPGVSRKMRYAGFGALGLCLYAVAVSGRRSVYLSLFLGLATLAAAFILSRRGRRSRMLIAAAFAIGFMLFLYSYGARIVPQLAFFQERIGMMDDRLRLALGESEDAVITQSFFSLQRQGVRLAFDSNPILGIGWGGFAKSVWSPTGHEVHSTPLRFVAELGLIGIVLYILLMAYLLVNSAKLFLRMRASPYGGSYLALALAFWTMSLSYVYNRHISERTFWLLLAVMLAQEAFSRWWLVYERRLPAGPAARPIGSRSGPAPGRGGAPNRGAGARPLRPRTAIGRIRS